MQPLLEQLRSVLGALARLDSCSLSGDDARALAEAVARLEKASCAAKARLALRVRECGAAPGPGDAVDWLARVSGISRGEARATLDAAQDMRSCAATAAAYGWGGLSFDQAREIAATEKESPGSEREMLDTARSTGLHGLREEGRRRRARAVSPDELHANQQAARRVRTWRDRLGMVCVEQRLTPEVGIPYINRLQAETDRVHKRAKREGSTEARGAHMADAFAAMINGGGKGHAWRADLNLVCDTNAWTRGHAHGGEASHIVGGGPLPVDVLKRMARSAFWKVVLHDGVNIQMVTHLGRHIPAELRTALELGAPPEFDGVSCVNEGCDRRDHLQWDHVDPVANKGPTEFRNLAARCQTDHAAKTERDRAAGLLGANRGPP